MLQNLDRYLFRQLLTPLILALVVSTAIVWLTQSLQRLEIVVDHGRGLAAFVRLTVLIIPSLLSVIIPFAVFGAVLFAFQRLQSDSEIAVMYAAGVSRIRLILPSLAIAALGALITLWINVDLMPRSYRLLKTEISAIKADVASALVRPGEFTAMAQGFTIYVDAIGPRGAWRGVLINDYRESGPARTYNAERAVLRQTEAGLVLILANGSIQSIDSLGGVDVVRFDQTSVNIEAETGALQTTELDLTERFVGELFHPDMTQEWNRQNAGRLVAEGHGRLSSPLYTFAYAMIAIYALIGGPYTRRGFGPRIAAACAAAGGLRIAGVIVQGVAADTGGYWIIYAVPLAPVLVLAMATFHVGSARAPSRKRR